MNIITENYKLYNDDCLKIIDELIKANIKVDCILTDPPYGTTQCKWDNIIPFEEMWNKINKLIKPNGAIILFGTEPFTSFLICSNPKIFKEKLIWKKHKPSNFGCAKTKHMKYTEDILVFYKKQCVFNKQLVPRIDRRFELGQKNNNYKKTTIRNDGNEISFKTQYKPKSYKEYDADWKNPIDVLEFPSVVNSSKEKVNHPTQKPIALLEYLIKTYTNESELVLDFTCGSGSTGVACMNLNRKFIGIELDKNYFSMSVERIFENYNK